jgi:hypothetical protein
VVQIQHQQAQPTADQIVEIVITELKPTVIRVIQETVLQSSNANLDNPDRLVETIIVQLRPVVLQSVR